jgi:hypothetical protein
MSRKLLYGLVRVGVKIRLPKLWRSARRCSTNAPVEIFQGVVSLLDDRAKCR